MGYMAKLTKSDVAHVAKLANLKLKASEVTKFQKQLSEVVEFIGRLEEVDTKNVEPTAQTTGLENVSKDDQRQSSRDLKQEEALSGTEKVHNGYFVVPGILEERSDY